jgi:hypothetical protein
MLIMALANKNTHHVCSLTATLLKNRSLGSGRGLRLRHIKKCAWAL